MLPVPTVAAVEILKIFFSQDQRSKVTLYRFLYMSNSDENHKGFKTFLYDNLPRNTGLHILSIIEQLSDVLNCSLDTIVAAMNIGEMRQQVKCLREVLKILKENDENHRLSMWRYGRIFSGGFMSDLQTKSCLKIVYILAEALRSEAPEEHSGILQIAQFADISAENKRNYASMAQRLLIYLKNQNPRSI
ncbi:unnamed protein product [Lactuca saligna]|uniref:Uncharacterized protein n=1 Tax=Lactuca saligna TaxID=75948 RepID=A0AA36EBX5_LACSI|nr:unnamed protein product [Lactuca saligna]